MKQLEIKIIGPNLASMLKELERIKDNIAADGLRGGLTDMLGTLNDKGPVSYSWYLEETDAADVYGNPIEKKK